MSTPPIPAPQGLPGQDRKVRLVPLLDKMGFTVEQLINHGWSEEEMVKRNMATYIIEPPEPESCILCAGSGHTDDCVVSEVTRQLIERDRHGREKYGVTLDRTDLSLIDWLQHQAEELMDGAGYALAAKREAERLQGIVQLATDLCSWLANDGRTLHLDRTSRNMLNELSKLTGVTK